MPPALQTSSRSQYAPETEDRQSNGLPRFRNEVSDRATRNQELLFVVNLYQTDTGLVVLASDDRGVATGSQTDRDRGFQAVGRSESIAGNQRGLACVTLPVVVRRSHRAIP